jgi:sugar phosphate isomerase/epimerase
MSRRHWLQAATLGAAGGFSALALRSAGEDAKSPAFTSRALGLIAGTIARELASDLEGTLRAVGALGYRFIEGGAPDGVDVARYSRALRAAGLESLAVGSSMADLLKEPDRYAREAAALGARYVVCYWPWMSSAESLTRAETVETAGRLNELGSRFAKAGLRLAWHNHDKEFTHIEGQSVFDILVQHTDAAVVGVELDVYWVVKGGADPVALFERYPGRFDLAHLKDMNNHDDRGITCVGSGILDFGRIVRAASAAGTRHLVVENERAVEGLRCARVSIQHLRTILD